MITDQNLLDYLSLLKEYTEKLIKICEEKQKRDLNNKFFLIAFSAVYSILALFSYNYLTKNISYIRNFTSFEAFMSILLIFLLTVSLLIIIYSIINTNKVSKAINSDSTVFVVIKLMRAASQYINHVNIFDKKLELELRLTEAQAVLEIYYKVFNRKSLELNEKRYKNNLSEINS